VRVVVVDDVADMRLLLRMQFDRDDRFEVVGEAVNGEEAIEVVAQLQPDLVILDRMMPKLGGLEAAPEIRRRAPSVAIVLYTAVDDSGTHQAALAAGALGVIEKTAGADFINRLAATLVAQAAGDEASVEVRVGPVSAGAARVWIANTKRILVALSEHPEVFDVPVPQDVLDLFLSFLDRWQDVAVDADEFHWAARAAPSDVERIVTWWGTIDTMSAEQLAQLGVTWSPPEGEPFFRALIAGVLEAINRHEETRRIADLMNEQWEQYLD
jgi:DNA-binding NarL/FixJ family response regulator